MKTINNFINEKLVIHNNSKLITNLYEMEMYKGVKLDIDENSNLKDFNKYPYITIDIAYELLRYIIDYFEKELQGYEIILSTTANIKFHFQYKNDSNLLGTLYFSEKYKDKLEELNGKGCYFIAGDNPNNKKLVKNLKYFVGLPSEKFVNYHK